MLVSHIAKLMIHLMVIQSDFVMLFIDTKSSNKSDKKKDYYVSLSISSSKSLEEITWINIIWYEIEVIFGIDVTRIIHTDIHMYEILNLTSNSFERKTFTLVKLNVNPQPFVWWTTNRINVRVSMITSINIRYFIRLGICERHLDSL